MPYYLSIEMVLNLPERDLVKTLRNEVDRYGFSYYLAKKIGLTYTPRAFTCWQHGWTYYAPASLAELNWGGMDTRNIRKFVVGNARTLAYMKELGYKNCIVGGLPFSYVDNQRRDRIKDSVVFFVPHSGAKDVYEDAKQLQSYIRFISKFRRKCRILAICAFGYDHINISKHLPHDVILIGGAHPLDKNSLPRLRAILETFEYMSTNYIGSHILYAAYCGCKVSITLPVFRFHTEDSTPDPRWEPSFAERIVYFDSEEYVLKEYSHFVCESPFDGVEWIDWARDEIGADSVLSREELISVLGWDVTGQIRGYGSGLAMRARRLLINFAGEALFSSS